MRTVFLCLAFAVAGWSQEVSGDWIGTLARPEGDMHLGLHITKWANGTLGTLEVAEQGVSGLPVDGLAANGATLTFDLKGVRARYQGTLDAAGSTINGKLAGSDWEMPLVFRRGTLPKVQYKAANPSDIDGDWLGTLQADGRATDIGIHLINTADGLVATLDEPAQYVKGAPASSVRRSEASLTIEWQRFGSAFEGKIAPDRSAIEGAVKVGGATLPLVLRRAKQD